MDTGGAAGRLAFFQYFVSTGPYKRTGAFGSFSVDQAGKRAIEKDMGRWMKTGI